MLQGDWPTVARRFGLLLLRYAHSQDITENPTFVKYSDFEKESQNPLIAILTMAITSLLSYPPLHKQNSL
jgi:hypothetical protein